MFIDPVPKEAASGLLAEIYESEEARWGFLPRFVETFSHNPPAYEAWLQLIGVVYASMDRRRCELATVATSRKLKSTCCAIAHGKMLRDRFYEAEEVVRIAADHHSANLDPVDVAIIDFAEKVAEDASAITHSDVDGLRMLGLTDRDVFDIVLAVAARAFFVTVIEALGTAPEDQMVGDLEPELVDVLAVGRAIPSG